MYKTLLALTITATCIACKNDTAPTTCQAVHTGTFSYNAKFKSGETVPFTIYRNDSAQIEVANNSKDTTVFALTWTKDCQYDLLLQTSSFDIPTDLLNTSKSIPLQTTINYIGKDFYVFTAERKANNFSTTDTVRMEVSN